jgi:hypothetical protein
MDPEPSTSTVEPGPRASAPRWRAVATSVAGPALIVVAVLFAMRGFLFRNYLTNGQPDILPQWLPHLCFLGRSLADGHVPLWNPFQMAGMPYAADPQSGWLNLPAMGLFTTFSCGTALRLFIALHPLLAGLGLYWFLRKEGLHRVAATAGGLSYAMVIGASIVTISLPFAGTLAWTPFVLVGASGYLSAERTPARLGWLALAAVAWGQVAASHMSHGLAMCTITTAAYVAFRSVRNVRIGEVTAGRAVGLGVAFMAFLPLANLALIIPRMALLPRTSLRAGYASVGGAVARLAGVEGQQLAPGGVWSGWPLALGSAPGTYAGAVILASLPAALRTWGKRYLAATFIAVGAASYVLTLNLFVEAGWFRSLVLHLPYGDVYLHNPGRLRYLMLLVVPVLGALGIQGIIERPATRRVLWPWLAAGVALFLLVPLGLGAIAVRYAQLAVAALAAIPALLALGERRKLASFAVLGVLAVELVGGVAYSQAYRGGTIFTGLETDQSNLVPGPLRWPNVPLDRYQASTPIVRAIQAEPGRFLTWVPPATFYVKGYLFTQGPDSWNGLENARGMLFGLRDALGYSPVQLTRYWSYIRATNDGTSLFYNAAVIQRPSMTDARLLGIRYVVTPRDVRPTLPATKVLEPGLFALWEVKGFEPLVSVVRNVQRASDGGDALRTVLRRDFDPARRAVVQADPGILPSHGPNGTARVHESAPEDLRISVDAPAPSIVVVRNAFDTGWEATVDGRSAPLLATDYFLQGVAVPEGHHEIRLVYRDPKIGEGLLLSGLVWLGLVLTAAASVIIARRRPGGYFETGPARLRSAASISRSRSPSRTRLTSPVSTLVR